MTEEYLVVGRPPRPPRRGRWGRRGPAAVVVALVVALAGWALWQGVLDSSSSTQRRAATPTPPVPADTESGFIAHDPPAVPYLRSGVLIRPADLPRGIPDGSWNDFAELTDGRVVLVQDQSLTVLSADRQPRSYELAGGITARPDGSAVAWTGSDGRVRRLDDGRTEPVLVTGARLLAPTCRGLRVGGRVQPDWQTCDRDGGLLSPDGHYFASIGADTVTVAPRADITGGMSVELPGTILDAVWEDPFHVLVVVDIDHQAHLERIGLGGETQDLLTSILGGDDRTRPVLVLPFTGGPGA
jgi:hypothetical protein